MGNALDRAISAVSPAWAARRAYWRAVLTHARAYDAAKTGRRTEGWITSGTSANAEIGPAAFNIRARARDLVRNNPWAAQAVRKLATKCTGTGIVPRLRAADAEEKVRASAADLWSRFSDGCDPEGRLDIYGLQRLVARTVFESGEALVRFIPRPSAWRLPVPLQLQVLEPDYLDSAKTQALPEGGAIIQGVEYDAEGRRVAYWLYDQHPGEAVFTFTRSGFISHRVPASEVLHIFDPLRPGQARGVSMFTPVALRMRTLDDYDDAELVRKQIGACFAAFVKQQTGPAGGPLAGKAATTDSAGKRIEVLRPGVVQYLALDEDVSFATPPAAEGYVEYMTQQLHAVAAGTGCTYEMLTGDLSRVNYSSLRAGMVDFWDVIDCLQWLVMIPQLCRPVWTRVGALLVATGAWNARTPFAATWTPPRRRWVDPVKEVQATKDAIRAGLMTQGEAISELGEDPDEHLAEIAAFNAKIDKLGLVLDSDPRKTGRAGTPALQQEPDNAETAAP